jgi:hypothetical protein
MDIPRVALGDREGIESMKKFERAQLDRQFQNRVAMGYPRRDVDGKLILDEKCRCGGMRSQHEDTLAVGHGPMPSRACGKLAGVGFVLAS